MPRRTSFQPWNDHFPSVNATPSHREAHSFFIAFKFILPQFPHDSGPRFTVLCLASLNGWSFPLRPPFYASWCLLSSCCSPSPPTLLSRRLFLSSTGYSSLLTITVVTSISFLSFFFLFFPFVGVFLPFSPRTRVITFSSLNIPIVAPAMKHVYFVLLQLFINRSIIIEIEIHEISSTPQSPTRLLRGQYYAYNWLKISDPWNKSRSVVNLGQVK